MALPTNYIGTILSWPWGFTKASRSQIPTTNGRGTICVPGLLVKQTFTDASTIATTAVSASHAGAGAAGTTNQTIDGTLASGGVATLTPPRNVVITVTHGSAVVAMSGTITGTDEYGATITEAWAVTAGTTSKTNTGKKAFKTVTSITETVAADASANTVVSGNGKVLGLSFTATNIIPIAELEDGTTPTAGVIVAGVAGSATVDARGTYTPNSTLNGAKDFTFYYTVDDPTAIQGT